MATPIRRLQALLRDIAPVAAADDRAIEALATNSREVAPGSLFIATAGSRVDGRAYIAEACTRGAAAVVYDTSGATPPPVSVPSIGVPELRRHIGTIADRFYGAPSKDMVVIGVTGTNGKTTCTQVLAQALSMNRISDPNPPLPPGRAGESANGPVDRLPGERATKEVAPDFSAEQEAQQKRGRGEGNRRISNPVPPPSSPSLLPEGEGGEPSDARRARRCAIIGTLGYGFPGALASGTHTTPDAVSVQRLLAEFRAARATHVSMEVSSHALDQHRVGAVAFEIAVFTNLTRDHLDYHGDMAAYGAAKAHLFAWPGLKTAVINTDDAFGRELQQRTRDHCRVLTYGLEHGDVQARTWQATPHGLVLQAVTPNGEAHIESPLLGRFNALNLLAVLAVLIALDIAPADAAARLSAARPVPGRVERFARHGSPLVVVDYAHTPDALEQVLTALRAHVRGQLWCVFGCGGNRDRGKRPEMGRIAEQLADRVIVTDDNPRDESGDAIVADIVAGMRARPIVIRDRAEAIAHAVRTAAAADVILIAGKGHEDYQEVRGVRRAYSDRDTVRAVLGVAA